MFMKKKAIKRFVAGLMGAVFFTTAFPLTEMTAKAEVNTDPIYYWYRPQNSDDIPKDTTFRILLLDEVEGRNEDFTIENTTVKLTGGKEYYYLKNNYSHSTGGNLELAPTHITGDLKYQIDYGADEFFTVGDLDTPYARRLNEVAKGTARDADGYTGWIDTDLYTRHKSKNSAGTQENSPLIRISTTNSFKAGIPLNCLFWNNTWGILTDTTTINNNLQNNFVHMQGQTDIFEFVVNPDNVAGENKAYTQESSYISYFTNKEGKGNGQDYDCALYFQYLDSNIWNYEVGALNKTLNDKIKFYYTGNGSGVSVSNIPATATGHNWTWARSGSDTGYYTSYEFGQIRSNLVMLGTVTISTTAMTGELNFRYRAKRDERGQYNPEALANGLLKLPKIYIGVPNRGVSELKPNNGSTNTFTVPENQTELIANNTYLRADRKLVVKKGSTLIVSGWLILHGELEVDGGTVIVDSGGTIVYLDRNINYNNAFSRDICLKNCTFIIMDGGKVVSNRFDMNNSTIINYGLFMSNWDKRVNSNYEGRRYSTCYESVNRIYPSYALAKKTFIKTNEGNGYPDRVILERGTYFPGNYKISGNTSKIIVSDMANKYNASCDYSDSQHIKPQTYYEKQ